MPEVCVTNTSAMICKFSIVLLITVEDFVSQRGVFSFATNTTVQCVSILITNDNTSEDTWECFTVGLSGASGYTIHPSVATVCINDDDGQWLIY